MIRVLTAKKTEYQDLHKLALKRLVNPQKFSKQSYIQSMSEKEDKDSTTSSQEKQERKNNPIILIDDGSINVR